MKLLSNICMKMHIYCICISHYIYIYLRNIIILLFLPKFLAPGIPYLNSVAINFLLVSLSNYRSVGQVPLEYNLLLTK